MLQPWVCNSTLVALNSQITGNGSVNGTFIWKIRNLLTNVAVTCITNSVNSPAPQSSNNFFLTRLTTYDSLTNYSPNFVTFNTQYAISVGPITSSGYVFGPECVFTTPARRIFTGVNSTINTCGTIINNNTNINCLGNSTNLSRYHWRITRVDGSVRDVYTNTNVLQFGNTSNNFVTFPTAPLPPATVFSGFLLPNTDYSFEVEETQGFVPNNPSLFGPACIFKTSGTMPVFRSGNVISINPNPIINNFTIKSSEWLSDKINVSVTDMMGNVIDKFEANPTEIENKAIGDKYPSGIYNVNIKQNDNVNNIRIIKK
ncbi:MAG: T9SS type A sorting domain-containing protein [Flavobacterium sp.]|nr:T9SS type A sorting domain-containing protein [Flavobacterium sp.]